MNVKTGYNIINFTIPSTCSRLAIGFGSMASYGGHGQISIVAQYAALYKGKYTIENLPTYTPYTKQMEMLRCGIPTSPKNVLKNSDFTNPLNTKGFSSISSGAYTTIDCWNSWISGNGGKIELTSSGIKLSPPSSENIGIYQQIENYQLNKIYTVVVYINNLPYLKSFQMGNYGVGTKLGPIYFYSIPSANVLIRINSTDSAVTIQKIALYEGAYTLDTIPMYQSESRHVEMLNCNVPLAPHNLLDNSNFRNPVNQRGITSQIGGGYGLDRWRADGSGTISVESTGVSLTNLSFRQPVQLKAGTYTLAFHLSDGKTLGYVFKFDGSSTLSAINSSWNETTGAYINYYKHSTGVVTVQIVVGEGHTIIVDWAALYEGSYDTSTLPAYQPKGYAAELAECQRYYWQYWQNNNMSVGNGYMNTTDTANITFEFPTKMRVAPTISFEDISTLRVMCVDGLKGITAYSVVKSTYNQMMVGFTLNSASTQFTPCILRSNSGVKIKFNADL